ncbi:hypothetical protein BGW36DRAFT_18322 [Talaromyces proteolyticus]|uniref:Rhodopsin domain-containing protein n=1 Tax=Talaromyces proteolyticus TaxID=1131652 RepID=A0AAD4L746_9EURO|nr:uncharacterized protein BGW36DRAFT_18322 [Talaromyces proteolyticus]KAH8705815.1 hypothetical protein BGW36DRAFT_18322 [Talaromyces proteolyticus]
MDIPAAGEDVTPTNYAPIVQVITWMLLATSFLSLLIRLMTRFFLTKRFAWDDVLIISAFVFSICQSVTYLVPAGQAWGRKLGKDFPATSLMPALRAQYAGNILFVLSIACTKISIPASILPISPISWHRVALQVLGGFVILWTLTSVLALSFQCSLPGPWDYITKTCRSRHSILLYVMSFSVPLELDFPAAYL